MKFWPGCGQNAWRLQWISLFVCDRAAFVRFSGWCPRQKETSPELVKILASEFIQSNHESHYKTRRRRGTGDCENKQQQQTNSTHLIFFSFLKWIVLLLRIVNLVFSLNTPLHVRSLVYILEHFLLKFPFICFPLWISYTPHRRFRAFPRGPD